MSNVEIQKVWTPLFLTIRIGTSELNLVVIYIKLLYFKSRSLNISYARFYYSKVLVVYELVESKQ